MIDNDIEQRDEDLDGEFEGFLRVLVKINQKVNDPTQKKLTPTPSRDRKSNMQNQNTNAHPLFLDNNYQ